MLFCLDVKSGLQCSSNLVGTTPGKLLIATYLPTLEGWKASTML